MWHNKELLTQTNQKSLLRSSVWIITLVLTILRTSKRRESRNRTLVINLYILTVCLSHWDDPTKGACRRRSSSPSSSPYPCKKATLRFWTPFFADRLISVDEFLRITTGSFVHVLSRSVGGKVRGILHRGKCNQYLLFNNAFAFFFAFEK